MNRTAIYLACALLGGCQTHLPPASYSPHYQGFTDANGHSGLMPVQCLAPAADDLIGLGDDYQPKLAPGCANNLVLLQMVESRRDLQQGRATGPTMAAPVGRAAQVYIDGYDREELRRRLKEQQAAAKNQEGSE
ncbi:hypothetical protein [Pseudomonas sp. NPDC007930]|uniref:hypothetical protein n=1 Tax=Pseudomonas sp. NPDC007930 TaxID=3364417 RepID=UPI0036E5AF45